MVLASDIVFLKVVHFSDSRRLETRIVLGGGSIVSFWNAMQRL